MKQKIFTLIICSIISVLSLSGQGNSQKKDPEGQWKFAAPYAPDGYQSGNIIIGLADKKYSASMGFDGSDYKFPGENVKIVKDSIFFSIYVEGEGVAVKLKVEDPSKMTGSARYSAGVIPLTLTKAASAPAK